MDKTECGILLIVNMDLYKSRINLDISLRVALRQMIIVDDLKGKAVLTDAYPQVPKVLGMYINDWCIK